MIAVRELEIISDNDFALYKRKQEFHKTALRKIAQGKYDRSKLPKLFKYLADEVDKSYNKQYGSGRGFMSNVATREALAEEFAKDFHAMTKGGKSFGELDYLAKEAGIKMKAAKKKATKKKAAKKVAKKSATKASKPYTFVTRSASGIQSFRSIDAASARRIMREHKAGKQPLPTYKGKEVGMIAIMPAGYKIKDKAFLPVWGWGRGKINPKERFNEVFAEEAALMRIDGRSPSRAFKCYDEAVVAYMRDTKEGRERRAAAKKTGKKASKKTSRNDSAALAGIRAGLK